jgi:hypothetical protein
VEFTEASGRTAPAAREKERKGIQRGVEKAAGDERTFIRSRTSNWQMGQLRHTMPDAAGGEGGHGSTKPDAVRC